MAKKTKTESETQSTESGFNVATFFDDTKEELGKVVWPSRQQLISESAAVLLMVILSATLIYLVDGLFVWVSQSVFLPQ
ncbi:preprotein translocase subunit SecE [Microcoleus sp. FACHB-53]|nr:preprotein translocase subunit SecE [Microcoleus sp. FACHB-53]MBD2126995.1 preprotein translocase subunit SecE [Microcoleus sp. FACHB-1]